MYFINSGIGCDRRDEKHGSFACVVNAKNVQNAGKFEKIVKTSTGVVSMYFTNKRGERFDRTSNYFFMKKPMENVDLPLKITINHNNKYQVRIKL